MFNAAARPIEPDGQLFFGPVASQKLQTTTHGKAVDGETVAGGWHFWTAVASPQGCDTALEGRGAPRWPSMTGAGSAGFQSGVAGPAMHRPGPTPCAGLCHRAPKQRRQTLGSFPMNNPARCPPFQPRLCASPGGQRAGGGADSKIPGIGRRGRCSRGPKALAAWHWWHGGAKRLGVRLPAGSAPPSGAWKLPRQRCAAGFFGSFCTSVSYFLSNWS